LNPDPFAPERRPVEASVYSRDAQIELLRMFALVTRHATVYPADGRAQELANDPRALTAEWYWDCGEWYAGAYTWNGKVRVYH
jgi:hypothetical protein